MRRKRIYISGPISKGDLLHNIQQADAVFLELVKAGFAPFNPMLSVYAGAAFKPIESSGCVLATASAGSALHMSHDDWIAIDLPWVEMADGVLRLRGESVGAEREVMHAYAHRIPTFFSIADLKLWFQSRP